MAASFSQMGMTLSLQTLSCEQFLRCPDPTQSSFSAALAGNWPFNGGLSSHQRGAKSSLSTVQQLLPIGHMGYAQHSTRG